MGGGASLEMGISCFSNCFKFVLKSGLGLDLRLGLGLRGLVIFDPFFHNPESELQTGIMIAESDYFGIRGMAYLFWPISKLNCLVCSMDLPLPSIWKTSRAGRGDMSPMIFLVGYHIKCPAQYFEA